ncbi:hypothetical protein, partial [Ralstonia solanacearum]|uniref:hypothetical protein n=1 Tax=Ralstonia solanacearum TaxID=305 RepID=UPI0035E6B40D
SPPVHHGSIIGQCAFTQSYLWDRTLGLHFFATILYVRAGGVSTKAASLPQLLLTTLSRTVATAACFGTGQLAVAVQDVP